jgi:hypothetical protein
LCLINHDIHKVSIVNEVNTLFSQAWNSRVEGWLKKQWGGRERGSREGGGEPGFLRRRKERVFPFSS